MYVGTKNKDLCAPLLYYYLPTTFTSLLSILLPQVAVTFLQNVEIVNTNDRRKPVGKGKGATKREQEQTGRLAEVTPSHGPAQPV
jgi:hypothetical protein